MLQGNFHPPLVRAIYKGLDKRFGLGISGTMNTLKPIKAYVGRVRFTKTKPKHIIEVFLCPPGDLFDPRLVGDKHIRALSHLERLQYLTIWGSNITDEGFHTVGNFTHLRSLDIQGSAITDIGLNHRAQLCS